MADIFISYDSVDRPTAQHLADALEAWLQASVVGL